MNRWIDALNGTADGWAHWMFHMSWQIAIVVAVVWLVSRIASKRSARFRHLLWVAVFLKLVLPPMLATPWSAGNLFAEIPDTYVPAAIQDAGFTRQDRASEVEGSALPASTTHLGARPESPVKATLESASPTHASNLSAAAWCMTLWAFIALALAGAVGWQYHRYMRLVLRRADAAPESLQAVVNAQAEQLGVSREAPVLVSPAIHTPAVFGLWRPSIVLPADWNEQFTAGDLAGILAHEVAHIKRGDLPVTVFAAMLSCAYWFHPAVWYANLQQRREREMACDDVVLEFSRQPGKAYAATLLRAAEQFTGETPAGAGFLGLMELSDNLLHRVRAATDVGRARRMGWGSATALVALLLVLPMGTWTASGQLTGDREGAAAAITPIKVGEAKALLDKAEALYSQNRQSQAPDKNAKLTEAIGIYRKIHEDYPEWNYASHGLMMIGICYDWMGEKEKALESFEYAADQYPDLKGFSEATYFYLGEAYEQAKQQEKALDAYEKCLALGSEVRNPETFPLKNARDRISALGGKVDSQSLAPITLPAGPAPELVTVSPAIGAQEVDPAITEIRVTFDQDMTTSGYSWTGGGEIFPKTTGKPEWVDSHTCVLHVVLEPAKVYRVGINSKSHKNFRSANGIPARPRAVYFATVGADPAEIAKLVPPAIVSMTPANAESDVAPSMATLTVSFDKPMGGGCSWVTLDDRFPGTTGSPAWNEDHTVCTLPVSLKPNVSYRLSLNSARHINFQSASGVPLEPIEWTFSTGQ
jgi:beta-lactamase regulating signal transducer with metallopeptidase domain